MKPYTFEDAEPQRYVCEACGQLVSEDEAVWTDPAGHATTGDEGQPYHVECAPADEGLDA